MPFQVQVPEETDAEFTEVSSRPAPTVANVPDFTGRDVVRLNTDVSANPSLELARYEKRARTVAIFVRLPVLAYIAFDDRTPGLIRAGAGLLAIWEAIELARGGARASQDTVTEWMGQP